MATAYDRGAAFERRVLTILEHHRWFAVRSAGSKGATDIMALDMSGSDRRPVLVQCKRTTAAVPPEQWNRLFQIAKAVAGQPVLANSIFDTAGRAVRVRWSLIITEKVSGAPRREAELTMPWSPSVPAGAALLPLTPEAAPSPIVDEIVARLPEQRSGSQDGGLTPEELAGIDQGKYPCARPGCGHGDAVHGPFCFVADCRCADWLSRGRRRAAG